MHRRLVMAGTWTGDGVRGGSAAGRDGGCGSAGRRDRAGAGVAVRLLGSLGALGAVAALLAGTAPDDWPHGLADLPRWLAAPPPEARLLALATVAAYGCLAWLALTLLAAAAGSGVRVAPATVRRTAERILGLTLATAAAGVLAAGPALAEGPRVRPQHGGGPFDRPVATAPARQPGVPPAHVTPRTRPALVHPAPAQSATARSASARSATAGPARVAGASPARGGDAVVVVRGDTLWDIAARHLGAGATPAAVAAEWPRWYAANRTLIGPDPGRILPGQRLAVPSGDAR
jgi:hypothetical protein